MIKMYKTVFHERINNALSIRKMKQIELANKTNINKSQINEYISGNCKPKQDKLELIAKALSVNPMWLTGFNVLMDENTANIKDKSF